MAIASRHPSPAAHDARFVASQIAAARDAQRLWSARPLSERLQVVRGLRHHLAGHPEQWVQRVQLPQRRDSAATLAAEILPLAAACRWLERHAARTLAPRRSGTVARWLGWCVPGLELDVQRAPYGVVLIIGTWNYPLLLTGVQTLQALVAGNAVLVKPGGGSDAVAQLLASSLLEAGLPPDLCCVLPEDTGAAQAAIQAGVDRIVLTGSAATGQAVLRQAAEQLTPCTMELSGCDAVFVRADANLERAARCIAFGLRWNGSATCIAPRRVLVDQRVARGFREQLRDELQRVEPMPLEPRAADTARNLVARAVRGGATLLVPDEWSQWSDPQRAEPVLLETTSPDLELLERDVFAPVLTMMVVQDDEDALARDRACPYALGAAIFGEARAAQRMARRIDAGCITINDLLAPTADPRVPFGGAKRSGFGVTRGAEGLLEMTRVKCVTTRHARWLAHLAPAHPALGTLLVALLRWRYGATWRERFTAGRDLLRAAGAMRHVTNSTNSGTIPAKRKTHESER